MDDAVDVRVRLEHGLDGRGVGDVYIVEGRPLDADELDAVSADDGRRDSHNAAGIALFGTVKVKRCVLAGRVTAKDDTRVQCSYLRDVLVPERCSVFYSSIAPDDGRVLRIPLQGSEIGHRHLTGAVDWQGFQTPIECDEYPANDGAFYSDTSRESREG